MEMPRLRRGFGVTLLLVYALYCVLNAVYGSQGTSEISSDTQGTAIVESEVAEEEIVPTHAAGPIEQWIDGRVGIAAAVIFFQHFDSGEKRGFISRRRGYGFHPNRYAEGDCWRDHCVDWYNLS